MICLQCFEWGWWGAHSILLYVLVVLCDCLIVNEHSVITVSRSIVHTLSSFNLYEDAIREPAEECDDLSDAISDPTTQ